MVVYAVCVRCCCLALVVFYSLWLAWTVFVFDVGWLYVVVWVCSL